MGALSRSVYDYGYGDREEALGAGDIMSVAVFPARPKNEMEPLLNAVVAREFPHGTKSPESKGDWGCGKKEVTVHGFLPFIMGTGFATACLSSRVSGMTVNSSSQ